MVNKKNDVNVILSMERYNDLLKTEETIQKLIESNYKIPVCFFWDRDFKKFYIPEKEELQYRGINV